MKFSDFVSGKAIRADLRSTDKTSVIAELVESLLSAGEIKPADKDDIVKAILKREELGSTGIGRGIAVPHTKHPSVNKLIGTVGVSTNGVEFESLDGEKVQLFFLLVINECTSVEGPHAASEARRLTQCVGRYGV